VETAAVARFERLQSITSDLALNAVLTVENPMVSTVLDVRCAQSYLLWSGRAHRRHDL
jgi:hypothetical protein